MNLVPAPVAGSKVTAEWLQQVTDTANELAASTTNLLYGTTLMPQSSFKQASSMLGTYYRSAVPVTFPAGSFTRAPIIVCSIMGSSPGAMLEATFSDVTKNGFTARCGRTDNPSASTTYYWIAMGATQ